MTADQSVDESGPLRSLIASAITENFNQATAQQVQAPQATAQPRQQAVAQGAAPQMADQAPVQTTMQAPVQDQTPPAFEQQVVSTAAVSDLDVSAMFKTPVTDAPASPPPLPPDTPVQAPPEIEQNERAKSAWEILRNRERESRHRAEALQSQLEAMSKQASSVADERAKFAEELKGRDDRIHELEDKLGKADLANSVEFRHQYDEQMENVAGTFRDALKDAALIDDDAALDETTSRLLSVNDSEFTRLVSKLPATAQGSLWDKRREYRSIASARENAIAQWKSAQSGLAEVDKQRQVIENAERRRSLAEQAIDFTSTQLPQERRPSVLFEPVYKQDVDSVTQQFRGFMQVASDDEIARVAYQGFLVPVMQRQVAFLAEAVGKWRDAYYAIRGAGAPPALPLRVQSERAVAPPPPVATPALDARGGSFSNLVQTTLAGTIRNAMGK